MDLLGNDDDDDDDDDDEGSDRLFLRVIGLGSSVRLSGLDDPPTLF